MVMTFSVPQRKYELADVKVSMNDRESFRRIDSEASSDSSYKIANILYNFHITGYKSEKTGLGQSQGEYAAAKVREIMKESKLSVGFAREIKKYLQDNSKRGDKNFNGMSYLSLVHDLNRITNEERKQKTVANLEERASEILPSNQHVEPRVPLKEKARGFFGMFKKAVSETVKDIKTHYDSARSNISKKLEDIDSTIFHERGPVVSYASVGLKHSSEVVKKNEKSLEKKISTSTAPTPTAVIPTISPIATNRVVKFLESEKLGEDVKPADTAKTMETLKIAEPVKIVEAVKPIEVVRSVAYVEPARLVEPVAPVVQTKQVEISRPERRTALVHPPTQHAPEWRYAENVPDFVLEGIRRIKLFGARFIRDPDKRKLSEIETNLRYIEPSRGGRGFYTAMREKRIEVLRRIEEKKNKK